MAALNRFNRVAGVYDELSGLVFGSSIVNAQTHFLGEVKNEGNVLVLGGGSGYWLPEFLHTHPSCRVYYLEASSKMIDKAKAFVKGDARVEFLHATEEALDSLDVYFDSVITCFYLDLFDDEELERVLSQVFLQLKDHGRWLISDFVNERWWHGWMLRLMYLFFKMVGVLDRDALPAWQMAIGKMEMNLRCERYYYSRFIRSVVMEKATSRQHYL